MKKMFLIAILILSSISVFAKIGETIEQCTTRYGKPVKSDEFKELQYKYFKKDNLIVGCIFQDGKCTSCFYVKDDSTSLSETEMENILKSDYKESEWTYKKGSWYSDALMYAYKDNKGYVITTLEFLLYTHKEEKKEKAAQANNNTPKYEDTQPYIAKQPEPKHQPNKNSISSQNTANTNDSMEKLDKDNSNLDSRINDIEKKLLNIERDISSLKEALGMNILGSNKIEEMKRKISDLERENSNFKWK